MDRINNSINGYQRGVRRFLASTFVVIVTGIGGLYAPMTQAADATCSCNSTYDKIVQSGVLKAGVRFDYPPLGSVDSNGNPAGFGPDLAAEFAKRLNVKLQLVEENSHTRVPLLLNGSFDLEIGPTSPTVEREKVIDFTIPYLWDSGVPLVRQGESLNAADYGPPKKVGVTQGSFFVDLFKAVRPDGQFTTYQEYGDAVAALKQKRIDAVLMNRTNAIYIVQNTPGLAIGKPFVSLPLGIMVRQNDSKWRNWVNWTLQRMWKDGTYKKIYRKSFGEDPDFPMWSSNQLQPGI
jgi:polar amino acid transport system substrate-binding protein